MGRERDRGKKGGCDVMDGRKVEPEAEWEWLQYYVGSIEKGV